METKYNFKTKKAAFSLRVEYYNMGDNNSEHFATFVFVKIDGKEVYNERLTGQTLIQHFEF